MDSTTLYQNVTDHYTSAAKAINTTQYSANVAKAFGYSEEELSSIPKDSNLGLSCGNPTALANLKEGETVIDLGSGAGFDVFLAAKRVGPNGRAIGVDMNKDMLARASKNLASSGLSNVTFVESAITSIPLPDQTADCIISNCVINLVPELEKHLVFEEMFRILKPGGRVAVSDILIKKDLPAEMKRNMGLYVGCISGASLVAQYEKYFGDAGFDEVVIADSHADLNVYKSENSDSSTGCCGEKKVVACCQVSNSCGSNGSKELEKSVEQYGDVDLNEWAASYKIYAIKSSAR